MRYSLEMIRICFGSSAGIVVSALLVVVLAGCRSVGGMSKRDGYSKVGSYRNVRDFGAKGDGVTDDTAAFIKALELGRDTVGVPFKEPANIYVPPGRYVVSDTLIIYRATLLAGDSLNPPTLILKDHASGFDDPSKPKPLLVTYGAYNSDPAKRDWTIRTGEVGGSVNNTFLITVRHLNIELGKGNPGAWGIYWLVAQQTALRNITINAGESQGCLKSGWWGGRWHHFPSQAHRWRLWVACRTDVPVGGAELRASRSAESLGLPQCHVGIRPPGFPIRPHGADDRSWRQSLSPQLIFQRYFRWMRHRQPWR